MTDTQLLRRRERVLANHDYFFYDEPLHLVRGEGIWMWDSDGKRYLDCYNNVVSVGHCHPRVVEALTRQARTLNTHTRYLHENAVELCERLGALLPGDLGICMLVCTGTEANDLAVQIARAVTGHRQDRAHVGGEGLLQHLEGHHGVVGLLVLVERLKISIACVAILTLEIISSWSKGSVSRRRLTMPVIFESLKTGISSR